MMKKQILRTASLAATLGLALMVVGCSSVPPSATPDPDVNFPITVAPHYQSVKLSFGTASGGLTPADEARFERFARAYLRTGTGSVSINVPRGTDSASAIRYFGERLVALGVPRAQILTGTRTITNADGRVELGFVGYEASTPQCGNWSDATTTASNLPMANFGCANQHNLAAMIRDPRDLMTPRNLGPSDATRRSTVLGKYEAGQTTSAQKTSDQTVSVTTQTGQ